MTQTIIIKRPVVSIDDPAPDREIVHVGTLDQTKRIAATLWFPGYSVSIRTDRGTTWTLKREDGEFVWRHDTGRRG